jgi:hypothetical protein
MAVLKQYPLHWDGDDEVEPKPPELVEGVLPEVGVALLVGQSGMYKTFVALDLAFSIATITPFAKRATLKQGGCLFVAAEAAQYVSVRLQGVKQDKTPEDRAIEPAPFGWLSSCPPLVADDALAKLKIIARDAERRLMERHSMPLALIVIDTVSAAAAFEDANSASENQRCMTMLAKFAEEMRALVLCVDHFGKDISAGPRNSSAKEASADAVLSLLGDRQNGDVINPRMVITKCRGGPTGAVIPFRKRDIELEGGGLMAVIDWAEEQEATARGPQVWPKKLHILKAALGEMVGTCGFNARPFLDGPEVRVVKRELVRAEYAKRWTGEPTAFRQAFSDHVRTAVAEGHMQNRAIPLPDGTEEMVFWPLTPC